MTFQNFKDLCEKHYDEEGPLRKGQSFMYNLQSMRPDLYKKLTGTSDDPFYVDKKLSKAYKKVNKLWDAASPSKYLVIGDVHCNLNTLIQAVTYAWIIRAKPILIGDLVDHRTAGMTKVDGERVLHFVLSILKADKALCVWGNHDLNYINPGLHGCSEWTYNREKLYKPLYYDLLDTGNFRPFIFLEEVNTLVTHAGLEPSLVGDDPIKELEEFFPNYHTALTSRHKFLGHPGGITWLRKNKHSGMLPNSIQQVVGHTPKSTVKYNRHRDTWYIDTLNFGDKSLLLLTEGQAPEIIPFKKYANHDYD